MKSIAEVVAERPLTTVQLTTEFNGVKSIDNCTTVNCRDVDSALQSVADLISDEFRAWYAKQIIRLGIPRFLGLASDARRGRQPKKLFSFLLRNT